MKKPYILASGNFHPSDIDIVVEQSNLDIDTESQNKIEDIWKAKEKEARENNLNFYNGVSYRLNSWKQKDGRLSLSFSTINFKERYGLNVISREDSSGESIEHRGCYVGANVRTSDGKYILVKLTGKSTNENDFEWLGGIAETDIPCDSGLYLFKVLYQELSEEAGIEEEDIADASLTMMNMTDNNHVGFHFDVALNISSQDLDDRFSDNEDDDIHAIMFYNWFAYVHALKKHNAQKQLVAEYMIEQDKLS